MTKKEGWDCFLWNIERESNTSVRGFHLNWTYWKVRIVISKLDCCNQNNDCNFLYQALLDVSLSLCRERSWEKFYRFFVCISLYFVARQRHWGTGDSPSTTSRRRGELRPTWSWGLHTHGNNSLTLWPFKMYVLSNDLLWRFIMLNVIYAVYAKCYICCFHSDFTHYSTLMIITSGTVSVITVITLDQVIHDNSTAYCLLKCFEILWFQIVCTVYCYIWSKMGNRPPLICWYRH